MELLDVEFKLLAFEDVSIADTSLAGARRDGGVETAGLELLKDGVVEGGLLETGGVLGLDAGGGGGVDALGAGLLSDVQSVVLLVPLTERGGVNLDDGGLDQGVGADQLVVGSVVDNSEETALLGDGLGSPAEAAVVKTQGTGLDVATAAADKADALGANPGHAGRATHFELALGAELSSLASSGAAFMP